MRRCAQQSTATPQRVSLGDTNLSSTCFVIGQIFSTGTDRGWRPLFDSAAVENSDSSAEKVPTGAEGEADESAAVEVTVVVTPYREGGEWSDGIGSKAEAVAEPIRTDFSTYRHLNPPAVGLVPRQHFDMHFLLADESAAACLMESYLRKSNKDEGM